MLQGYLELKLKPSGCLYSSYRFDVKDDSAGQIHRIEG